MDTQFASESISDKVIRIYVSSTFPDMASERVYLHSYVFPQVQKWCDENGFKLDIVDFYYQRDQPGDVTSLDSVKNRLKALNDSHIVICLIGERFGEPIILPQNIGQVVEGIKIKSEYSIECLEVKACIHNMREMNKKCFFYYRDPDFINNIIIYDRNTNYLNQTPELSSDIKRFFGSNERNFGSHKIDLINKVVGVNTKKYSVNWSDGQITGLEQFGKMVYNDVFNEMVNNTYPNILNRLKDKKKDVRAERKDKNVQFTVYRPGIVVPERWYPLLAFAHLTKKRPDSPAHEPDPIKEVERRAAQTLGTNIKEYGKLTSDSSQPIPLRGEITFVPMVDGIEFNPPSRSFLWIESVHKEEFQMCATGELDGQIASGKMMVFLGKLVIAEISMNIEVDSKYVLESAENPLKAPVIDVSRPFRKIFASYSHKDKNIVNEVKQAAMAIGDEYLCDVTHIRSGEVWDPKISEMIRDADIFQLFWSWNSMESEYVKQEYDYALSLNRILFVRPTYWEDPFPEKKDAGQPPEYLKRLQFMQISPRTYSIKGKKTSGVENNPIKSNIDYEYIKNDLMIRYPPDDGEIPYQYMLRGTTAKTLSKQAEALYNIGDIAEAESLYRKAINEAEKELGPTHPQTAEALKGLAKVLRKRGDIGGAEAILRRVLEIHKNTMGPMHIDTAVDLSDLAVLYYDRGEYDKAENLIRRAIGIDEITLGLEHSKTVMDIVTLAHVLGKKGKIYEVEYLLKRAKAIGVNVLGPDHPTMIQVTNNLKEIEEYISFIDRSGLHKYSHSSDVDRILPYSKEASGSKDYDNYQNDDRSSYDKHKDLKRVTPLDWEHVPLPHKATNSAYLPIRIIAFFILAILFIAFILLVLKGFPSI